MPWRGRRGRRRRRGRWRRGCGSAACGLRACHPAGRGTAAGRSTPLPLRGTRRSAKVSPHGVSAGIVARRGRPACIPLAAKGFGAPPTPTSAVGPAIPPDAVEALAAWLDLRPGRTVLDLARRHREDDPRPRARPARASIAVEPVAGMRARLEARRRASRCSTGRRRRSRSRTGRWTRPSSPRRSTGSTPSARCPSCTGCSVPGRPAGPGVEPARRVRAVGPPAGRAGRGRDGRRGAQTASRLAGAARRGPPCSSRRRPIGFEHVHRLDRAAVVDRVTSISTVAAPEPRPRRGWSRRSRRCSPRTRTRPGRDVVELPVRHDPRPARPAVAGARAARGSWCR